MYSFTSENETLHFDVHDSKDGIIGTSVSGSLDKSVFLFSGTTYLIYINSYDASYVVTMKKQENAVSVDVDYEIDFPRSAKKQYSFTPETSGYYLFCAFGYSSAPYVYDGSKILNGITDYALQDFQGRVVELEAGKSYKIQVSHSQNSTEGMYWCVKKVESLVLGEDIPVNAIFGYAYYTLTPEESGVYTFTS